ncbi:MAG: FKBP-type peptidyl-prolyl cis-trans isomerase [Planctomycetes bacterium]|nr:FKBP-type peptidyl-prolyl cis-trans isomerase [Planctomycetota bacterium]
MTKSILTLVAVCGLSSSLALAHIDEPKAAAPAVAAAAPAWTNPEFAKLGAMLIGSWKSSAPVAQGDDASKSTDVVVHFAPVVIEGMSDTIYMESARADKLNTPYREAVIQFYKSKGATHIRTFEFRRIPGVGSSVTGLWAAPDAFPKFKSSDLIGTLNLAVTLSGETATAKTPTAYPTGLGGAIEMTSEMNISASKLDIADRGFDASGKQVWGPAAGAWTSFSRFDSGVKATRLANGIIAIDYTGTGTEPFIQASDRVAAHYEGWLASGYKFDSSRDRAQPLNFLQGSLIPGWNDGLIGIGKGAIRRLVVPAAQAYGDRARGMIPANADLFFEIEIMNVERPAPAAQPAPAKIDGAAPAKADPKTEAQIVEEIKRKAAEQANKNIAADEAAKKAEEVKKAAEEAAKKAAEAIKPAK